VSDWFESAVRGGECADLARGVDWSRTPLGDPSTWAPALRSAVELCFSTRFAVLVTWGPELTMIYNDGYRAMLGTDLHPRAMGASAAEVWGHVWDDIGPLFTEVLATGTPTWDVDLLLWMQRSGYTEETRFTFSYSPLRDEDDIVRGVLDIATETTGQVVDRRRLALLGRLATALQGHRDQVDDTARIVTEVLSGNQDITAAHLYRGDDPVTTIGPAPDAATTLLARVHRTGRAVWHDHLLATPVGDGRPDGPAEVLLLRGNPHRPLDAAHRGFLELVAATIGTALAEGAAHRRRIARMRTVSDALQHAMVPDTPPSSRWETRYRPADDTLFVGGDWFDVVGLPDGRFGLVVGDCVGHGVDAATSMGRLSSAGRALMLSGAGPARTLELLDDFARTVPGTEFTTVFCGVVDRAAGTLTYSSAGHLPGLVVHDGCERSAWLEDAQGTPLTLHRGPRPERTTRLSRGDTVVLYTDGLVERRGEHLRTGLDRLVDVAREACRGEVLADLPDHLLGGMLPTGARDDVAIVVYRAD
jgi:hypothetical protein